MSKPLVTVLMPVYNAEKFLPHALNSIVNQTYQNLDILIINDGSTDNSKSIIIDFAKKDKRIRYFEQENQGVAKTLRRGVELANGTLIRRHDADDISLPKAIEEQVNFLLSHNEVGAVATQQCHLTENGKIAKNKRLPKNDWFNNLPYKELSINDFTIEHSAPIVHGTTMFYKDLALEIGNYRPQFLVAEDYDLWLRIMEKKKIVILNTCTYFLRIHNNSAISRYKKFAYFYNNLAIKMAKQRQTRGKDDIELGIEIPKPLPQEKKTIQINNTKKGKTLREDLNFMYSFAIDAKDWKLSIKIAWQILRDGWLLPKTYKFLIMPLLGKNLIEKGVKIKARIRKITKRNSK